MSPFARRLHQASTLAASAGWKPGAAGTGVATGDFGAWRGNPVLLGGSWSDPTPTTAVAMYQIDYQDPSAEYRYWPHDMDIALGGMWTSSGQTWAQAASGALDSLWTQILQSCQTKWTFVQRGTLHLRPFHEWNGNWEEWSVTAADIPNFITAWRRFYAIKQSVFPAAKFVFNTNGNTSGQSYDWTTAWPGDAYVDVYSTDWYSNHWALGGTYDGWGAPQGLEQHRQFALAHGKPLAVSEWGTNFSATGDQPDYIQFMHDFGLAHGGAGAGQLLYDSFFNVIMQTNPTNQYVIYPQSQTLSPNASAKYQQLY